MDYTNTDKMLSDNITDFIYIIILYYMVNLKIYQMFNFNIIFNYDIIKKIYEKNIYKEIFCRI